MLGRVFPQIPVQQSLSLLTFVKCCKASLFTQFLLQGYLNCVRLPEIFVTVILFYIVLIILHLQFLYKCPDSVQVGGVGGVKYKINKTKKLKHREKKLLAF